MTPGFGRLFRALALATGLAAPGGVAAWDAHQNPPPLPRNIQDWVTPSGKKEFREFPQDGSVQMENPPVFGWKSDRTAYTYQLRILRDGQPFRMETMRDNLFRPEDPLPTGTYQWQVRRLDRSGAPQGGGVREGWSEPRRFRLSDAANSFGAPPLLKAAETAQNASRPRSLAKGVANLRDSRADLFGLVERRFLSDARRPIDFGELRRQVDSAGRGGLRSGEVRGKTREIMRRMNDAVAIYALSPPGDRRRAQAQQAGEAYLRGMVSLDAVGRTGHAADDLLNIRIAKTMARAYDILYGELDAGLRAQIRRHIELRVKPAFKYFFVNERGNLSQYALSSHGFQIATHLLAISSLMIGESKDAAAWFHGAYPLVSAIVTPWGGGDGGYSNGVNYGVWEFVNHIDSWDVIENATGFRAFDTVWVRNFVSFLNYATPPGVAYAGFGDGGELLRPVLWAEIVRLYQERGRPEVAVRLLEDWQAYLQSRRITDEVSNALLWPRLFASPQSGGGPRAQLPDAAIFPDIGWAMIHSDLGSPERYSVLFKSSQYGSFSHSHADQNSFHIMGAGKPLLIDSGYYDGYRTPHHNSWTRQTRAHNAITFDGGQGQPIDDPDASGRLIDYWRCGEVVKLTGEAATAYGGDVTRAERTLVRLPGSVLLIHDYMEARTPKRWEWNFHAAVPIRAGTGLTASVSNGAGRADIEVLNGPEMKLKVSDGFPEKPDPRKLGEAPDQFHGVFVADTASAVLSMLTVIRLGGAETAVSASRSGQGRIAFRTGDHEGTVGPGDLYLARDGADVTSGDCEVRPRASAARGRLRTGPR
ncbi:MAG: heparinase II/III family protein [Minwuia sp.]|uniref:heparinase II/III domain-containing protein n=1 Tax=Minwuia sp. TaxID=2493630 RepID=UPI003A8562DA